MIQAQAPANASNESVIGYVQGEPIVVEQGPAWLAQLLYAAPPWAGAAVLVAFIALAGAAVVAARRVEIDEPVVYEMIDNISYILGMGGTTALLVESGTLPYLGDVVVGVVAGWVVARALIAPAGVEIYRGIQEQDRDSNSERAQMMADPWFEMLLLMPVALVIGYLIELVIGRVGLLLLCGLLIVAVFARAWIQTGRQVREHRAQNSDERAQQTGPILLPGFLASVGVAIAVGYVVMKRQQVAMRTHDTEVLCMGFFGCGSPPPWFLVLAMIATGIVVVLLSMGLRRYRNQPE